MNRFYVISLGQITILFCLLHLGSSTEDENPIRIAAYDPNPKEYLSESMMARRMGPDPGYSNVFYQSPAAFFENICFYLQYHKRFRETS